MMSYMSGNNYLTEFKETKSFEQALGEITNCKNVSCVNNGTVSLSIALKAVGVKPGDVVIVPNFTMFATASAAWFIGADIAFCDVRKQDLLLDLNLAEEMLSDRVKAVIITNANGRTHGSAEFSKFYTKCHNLGIAVIEDAAQGICSKYDNGVHAGLLGDIGSLSFSVPKLITTGQGGALITHNAQLADRIKFLKDFGRSQGGNDIHCEMGINSKFTDLQAVIGLAQLRDLSWRVNRKKEIHRLYSVHLKHASTGYFFDYDISSTVPWFYEYICDDKQQVKAKLDENGIGTRDMYPRLNKQVAFVDHYQCQHVYPVSKFVEDHGIWLPSSLTLSDDDIYKICSILK